MEKSEQTLVTGIRKWLIYFRIAIHVALHFFVKAIRGKMPPLRYPAFLFRALVFLFALRHSKIVKLRSTYKIHLYIPAYPKPSFFYTLEKLYRNDPGPATVVLSMTRACSYNCPHCYQQKDSGQDLDMNLLIDAASAMQKLGVTMFDIEGGEPLARIDRLLELMNSLDYRAEIWINTTGAGLTDDMLTKLIDAKLAGVMVSLHTTDEDKFDKFTAVPGAFKTAKDAIRAFGSKGLFTAINFVPTPEMVQGNEVEDLFDLAKELNCSFVQVIHGKAAGGWLGDTKNTSTENTMIDKLKRLHLLYNSGKKPGYPSISAQVFEEDVNLFGCTSGGVDRFYMGADGEVQPCEFLNISFGNVNTEPFEVIFKRMRREFATPCSDWLCCTMATRIDDTIKEHGLTRTPIPWKITKDIIPDWNRGKPTKFYKKLGFTKGRPNESLKPWGFKMSYFLVCNPGSRNFKSKQVCEKYIALLNHRGVDFDYKFTKNMAEAKDLAVEGIAAGHETIVAVGGDGTINRVMNGVLSQTASNSKARLGILYSGTSPDFCQFHHIPTKPRQAVESLLSKSTKLIDACKIDYLSNQGNVTHDMFSCSSNIGLGAGIASQSNYNRRKLGDFVGTLFATISTIAKARTFAVDLVVDGREFQIEDVINISIGKNPHIASGLKLNTKITPDNGKMFLFVIHGISKPGLLLSLGSAYSGKITENKSFSMFEVNDVVEVSPRRDKIEVEFDGDPWGYCPARISIMKKSIELVVGNE